MINRWLELSRKKSLLLVGPRRAGKTTLLKTRFPDFRYATLDDYDLLNWANKDPKGFIESLGGNAIIDEIQRCPRLTVAVKYAIDNQGAKFLLSGSSTLGLLDAAADSMAGRIHIQSLPTLCWGEEDGEADHALFSEHLQTPRLQVARRKTATAMKYGQFPEIASCEKEADKLELLENYKNTYFIRDLLQLGNIEHGAGLLAIFHHLVRSLGSLVEVSSLARESGLSYPSARKYLNILTQTQLTFPLYGYQYGPAKRFIKAAKIYFSDTGIITAMNQQVSIGQQVENFVIAELEKRRKLGTIKADQLYYYRNSGGREIDCIFEAGDIVHAIEIKSSETFDKRDISHLREFVSHAPERTKGFLFYLGTEYLEMNGIKVIPIAGLFGGV
ncbi:MAG: ATP-binding protein [Candidatus Aminicenantes bacterium]|nr:ATP-binding protein [Candidatus Aminicenantes bacterium]